MTERRVEGIIIDDDGDRVVIRVPDCRWEGSASEAERLLTRLHYVLARARPGTNIASMFLNGQLWGGKVVETDRADAIHEMRILIDQLALKVTSLQEDEEGTSPLG